LLVLEPEKMILVTEVVVVGVIPPAPEMSHLPAGITMEQILIGVPPVSEIPVPEDSTMVELARMASY
jgi:hypothetical protein